MIFEAERKKNSVEHNFRFAAAADQLTISTHFST